MKRIIILNNFDKIKEFTNSVSKFESDVDLMKGRYIVDAKSTIGIMTLNLSEPVEIQIHSEDEEELKAFEEFVSKFM